jgi:hypothetical protein
MRDVMSGMVRVSLCRMVGRVPRRMLILFLGSCGLLRPRLCPLRHCRSHPSEGANFSLLWLIIRKLAGVVCCYFGNFGKHFSKIFGGDEHLFGVTGD